MVDDNELVTRSLAGDRNAFGELVTRYQGPLFNIALRILRDREEAKDATQAAFVKAWVHLEQFDRGRRFFSWLYRIQMNEALNRRTRTRTHEELDPNLPARTDEPGEIRDRGRTCEIVNEALLELSKENRDVVILRHWLDLSYEEIGERLGIPAKTVKSRLFTARQRLGEILRNRGVEST